MKITEDATVEEVKEKTKDTMIDMCFIEGSKEEKQTLAEAIRKQTGISDTNQAMNHFMPKLSSKVGKSTGGLSSSIHGLKESNKPRHYSDTTHNYGNFFMESRGFPEKIVEDVIRGTEEELIEYKGKAEMPLTEDNELTQSLITPNSVETPKKDSYESVLKKVRK